MSFFSLVLVSITLGQCLAVEKIVLDIPQGSLEGLKTTTAWHGMTMYSFKGIPYARPNTNRNKFQMPEPADNWTGVRDATKFGSQCVFFCFFKQDVVGDEDCLFLNVYTPDPSKDGKKPVIVYIHGGGFNYGSGDDNLYGPDFLIEKDVVVVTINYRLGAVGYLNTGDGNAPGNAGLKDQVLALKWIRNNIINFGGCPDKITLFGHSAGAASVQYHILSPMSQGLFRSAIMQSGSVGSPWAISLNPKGDAMLLGKELGITAKDSNELVEKLKDIPTKDIVKATMLLAATKNFLGGEMNLFAPSVEADMGQEIFLPSDPWELLQFGDIHDVPVIIGVTAQEAGVDANRILPSVSELQDHFSSFIPKDLNMTDPTRQKEIADELKMFYFNGKLVSREAKIQLTDILSDVIFNHGSLLTAGIMSQRMTSPVYQYLFSYGSSFGLMKAIFELQDAVAMHGDDLTYEFYSNIFKNKPAPGSSIEKKTNEMVELLTNFAKTGDPSSTMDSAKVKWEPMGSEKNYLDIGENLTMKQSILKERVSFWAGFYKDVLGDFAKYFN